MAIIECIQRTHKRHHCALDIGSDSMLPKTGGKTCCRSFKKLTLIMMNHPLSIERFISYPAVVAERQRQVLEGGAWVIHPYSMISSWNSHLRSLLLTAPKWRKSSGLTLTRLISSPAAYLYICSLIWRTYMIVIDLIYMVVAPMRFCYILPKPVPTHHPFDYIILTLKCVVLIDIIVNFNMGYRDKRETYIVLTRRRIALHYLTHWFLVDIITCFPFGFLVPYVYHLGYKWQMCLRAISLIRCVKVYRCIQHYKTFLQLFEMDFMERRLLALGVAFAVSLHWCSCLVYMAAVTNFYKTGKPAKGYCRFLVASAGDLTKSSLWFRYKKAIFIACAAFFGTAFRTFRAIHPDEIITNAVVIVYGQLFMLYCMACLLKIYLTSYDTTMQYQELMNQVEIYMSHKQFPASMRTRVREFYKYRYQERYFREQLAMDSLSEQLRNEITLDTCHKLIEKVSLFEGLPPSVVGSVLGCLHPEVYLPNDLVTRAGDIGDCMYFIACGTVAVYSLKGAEVCHLDDGAHFGEVALLMKDHKRATTAIAIEITQVYRLDQKDFKDFIMTNQELYERVEALASKRMHETTLIDDPFKQGQTP